MNQEATNPHRKTKWSIFRFRIYFPPWRQPRGKWMVDLVNSHTNATSKRWHLWEIDLRFALNSTPGWGRDSNPNLCCRAVKANSRSKNRAFGRSVRVGGGRPTPRVGISSPRAAPQIHAPSRHAIATLTLLLLSSLELSDSKVYEP